MLKDSTVCALYATLLPSQSALLLSFSTLMQNRESDSRLAEQIMTPNCRRSRSILDLTHAGRPVCWQATLANVCVLILCTRARYCNSLAFCRIKPGAQRGSLGLLICTQRKESIQSLFYRLCNKPRASVTDDFIVLPTKASVHGQLFLTRELEWLSPSEVRM